MTYVPRNSGISEVRAGCFECHGYDGHWFAKNAMMVAHNHAKATGHSTWCDQVTSVTFNPKD
jgi:hypothetical protein